MRLGEQQLYHNGRDMDHGSRIPDTERHSDSGNNGNCYLSKEGQLKGVKHGGSFHGKSKEERIDWRLGKRT